MANIYPDNLWSDSYGNITLGSNGVDDAAGNATYPTIKNDVELPVGPELIVSDTQPALTYDGTRTSVALRRLVNATHKVLVPLPQELLRTYVPGAGITGSSKGVLVKALKLFYRVNTSDLTSITAEIDYKAFVTEATLGAPTVPAVTVSGGTITAAANIYTLQALVTTPFFVTATGSRIWGMATIIVPTNTCDILGATWTVGYGLY